MGTEYELDDIFESLYSDIKQLEEQTVIEGDFSDVSYNDIRVCDAIGDENCRSSSEVAKKLRVTMGTLTKAIDGLVGKGYVNRERSESDKRKVLLSLSEKGKMLYRRHKSFHTDMINAIMNDMDEDDKASLGKILGRVSLYLNPNIKKV